MPSANGPPKSEKAKGKARASSSSEGSKNHTPLSRVVALQKALASSADLNPLQELIEQVHSTAVSLCGPGKEGASKEVAGALKALHVGIQVLQRSFVALLKADRIALSPECDDYGRAVGSSMRGGNADSPEALVQKWLQGRWNALVLLFCSLLGFEGTSSDGEDEIRKEVLDALILLHKEACASLTRQVHANASSNGEGPKVPQWSRSPWRALMLALVAGSAHLPDIKLDSDDSVKISFKLVGTKIGSRPQQDLLQKFADELLESYDDARYAALKEMSSILRNPPAPLSASQTLRSNALKVLVLLPAVPAQEADLNAFLVPEMAHAPRGKASKPRKTKKGDSIGEDGDSEAGLEGEEDDMEDWFSDSDEEGDRPNKKAKLNAANGSAAALGKRAVQAKKAANSRKRGRSAMPFHEAIHSIPQQRAAFSNAWLSLLLPSSREDGQGTIGGRLTLTESHEVLLRLHIQIMPHLVKPNMLLDWLVDSLDAGGATGLLALNGLFTLITKHNLDYPAFYTRLYALLGSVIYSGDNEGESSITPSVLHMRYRSRFLRLLETFLSSTHLPAALIASFAKRLSRLALRAPPAAIVSIIPLIWTLLKRHPQCTRLIHRDFSSSSSESGGPLGVSASSDKGLVDKFSEGPAGVSDPYDATEPDPNKTRALESSLWELASLGASLAAAQNAGRDVLGMNGLGGQSHWLHSVTTLSRILAEPFRRERYDLEDFLDITYATLFETETAPTLKPSEKRKRNPPPPPALAYDLPKSQLEGQKTYRAFMSQSALSRMKEEEAAAAGKGGAGGEARMQQGGSGRVDVIDLWTF